MDDVHHGVRRVRRGPLTAGGGDQTHHPAGQVGPHVLRQKLREVQGVLGYARERPVVGGRAKDEGVRLPQRFDKLLDLRAVVV